MTFISESLNWPEKLNTLQSMPKATRAEHKEALNLRDSQLTSLRAIQACFDPEAMKKVHLAAQSNPPYIFSFSNAEALAGLKGKVAGLSPIYGDLPTAVHTALDFALANHLTTVQIKALVRWIVAGKSVAEFDPKAKPVNHSPKVTGTSSLSGTQQTPVSKPSPHPGANNASKGTTIGQRIDSLLESLGQSATSQPSKARKIKKSQNNLKGLWKIIHWLFVKLFWHGFIKQVHKACKAVAHYVVPIKSFENSFPSKHGDSAGRKRSGSSEPGPLIPTLLHWAVYCLCQLFFWWVLSSYLASRFIPSLKPWVDLPFRWLAHWLFVDLLGLVWPWALSNAALAIGAGVLLFIGLSAAFKAQPGRMTLLTMLFVALWIYGRGWNASLPSLAANPTNPQPSPIVATSTDKPEIKKQTSPRSGISSPSVIAFVEGSETQDYLEQELVGTPKNSVINPHDFQPDTAMGSDMAYHLIMDLQSSDKYTVFCGRDKVKVTNIVTGASQITLTMQIGLLSPLTGSSQFNFYWADLKIIHTNLIGTGLVKKYQCSLVLAESKKPLTIQCDSAMDLERLVSALEFYIKLSGHNAAPLTGLPYLNQGVRLDNDGQITTLWGNSPIDKAGLVLGDFIWSVGTKTDHQQNKAVLESALQALNTNGNINEPLAQPSHGSRLVASTQVSGSNDLYYVTAKGWKMALANKVADDPDSFRPLRRKVSIIVP